MWWTLAAATIASVTALLIAFVAYPWQRALDRKNEVLRERRAAYADFIEQYTRARIAVVEAKHDFEDDRVIAAHQDLLVSQKKLSVIASDAILEMANDLQSRFLFQIDAASRMDHHYFKRAYPDPQSTLADFDETINEAWVKLIDEMRAEVAHDSSK